MKRRAWLAGAWLGSLALVALLLRQPSAEPARPGSVADVATSSTCERPIAFAPPPRAASPTSLESIRAVVRDEVAAARQPDDAPAPPAVDEQVVARAYAIVGDATARARWTATDRDALRAVLPQLGAVEAEDVIASLFAAINRGEVAVAVDGPPF